MRTGWQTPNFTNLKEKVEDGVLLCLREVAESKFLLLWSQFNKGPRWNDLWNKNELQPHFKGSCLNLYV